MQGFAIGSELPDSIAILYESIHKEKSFVAIALLTVGANVSIALVSKIVYLLNQYTTQEFMASYGFRILFLTGALTLLLGIYIRKNILESSQFDKLVIKDKLSIFTIFHNYKLAWLKGFIICLVVSLITTIFMTTIPVILRDKFLITNHEFRDLSLYGPLILAMSSLLFAVLSNLKNYKKLIAISFLLTALFIILTFFVSLVVACILIALAMGGINGLFFYYMATLFPTHNRVIGISLCFNSAYVASGVISLLISTVLV